jgi:Membrane protein involved in the export of O-antigen and teichoic acid
MITIFIAVLVSFIDSGFAAALIRKQNCTDVDFSTVFYFNLAVSVLFYWILFFSAPAISRFFNEPQLTNLVKVLAIVLIIDSLTIIQRTILTKRIDFKLQTKISVIASIVSGVVGITLAFNGFGVWSLAVRQITQRAVNSGLLWVWNRWRPLLRFSRTSFSELFSFGYKLLISGLIDTLYRNIYLLIIGKYFSSQELGYYTRANQFQSLPSANINGIISRVSYPILAQMQDDKTALKRNYQKLIKSVMFITFVLMMGMAAVAEPMVITLIGEQWRPCVIYLQLLCFVGMMYPLHALNLNMLNVQGRSDLFLKLEIIKKVLAVPVIVIGVMFGIKAMIVGMIVNTQIAYFLNSYWSGRFIDYSMKDQVKDILPSFILAVSMALIVAGIGRLLPFGDPATLAVQVVAGAVLVFVMAEVTRLEAYVFMKEILHGKLATIKTGREQSWQ